MLYKTTASPTTMDRAFLDTLTHIYDIPAPAMQQVAVTIAERCALIANRYGKRRGTTPQTGQGSEESVGAHIGAAILAEFEQPEALTNVPSPTLPR